MGYPEYMQNVITTEEKLAAVVKKMEDSKFIVFDLESTGFSFITEEIVGIGIGTIDDAVTQLEMAVYIPVMYHEGIEELLPLGTNTFLPKQVVFDAIRPHFLDWKKLIIAHNLKFDMQHMINEQVDLRPKLCAPPWHVPTPKAVFNTEQDWRDYLRKVIDELPKEASCADTMVMSWLLDENKSKHGLKDIAKNEFGLDMSKLDKILGKKYRFHEAPANQTLPYALMDIVATGKAFIKYYHELMQDKQLWNAFFKIEMPFVAVLQGIERRGMPVNTAVLETIGERCEREMAEIQKDIYKLAGKVFNIDSAAQLAEVLHTELGMPVIARTAKGAVKTDAATMEQLLALAEQNRAALKDRHLRAMQIIEKLLAYRKMKKVHGTYVVGILEKLDADGRLHAGFHQTGTVTGRLSSSGPNLQNLPSGSIFKDYITPNEYWEVSDRLEGQIRMEKGLPPKYEVPEIPEIAVDLEIAIQKHFMFTIVPVEKDKKGKYSPCDMEQAEMFEIQWKIRDAFQEYVKDWWLVVGDLSQMELRMTAVLTNDQKMIEGFKSGADIHYYNATVVTGKPMDEITKEERRDAKAVSFGLVYGKTVRGFAIDWYGNEPDFWKEKPSKKNEFGEINKKYLIKTQAVIDRFFAGFPDVAKGIEATHVYAQRTGFVRTITGRKRRIPEIFSMVNGIRNRAKRQFFNAKVQGSSADYLKMAMIKIERELYLYQLPSTEYQVGQICQVHDELLVASRPEVAEECLQVTQHYMEHVIELPCPIVADFEIGYKYGSAK